MGRKGVMAVLKDLIVHGPSRFLNSAYFNSLKTNTIGAEQGIFNKLIATDASIGTLDVDDLTAQNATVVGLLDVKGQLHTNSWTNSNIATIDGSFYITPTIKSKDYDSTNYPNNKLIISQSSSNWSIDITSNALALSDSVYTQASGGTVMTGPWTTNSKVALTGEVLVDTTWMPLGTLLGTVVSITGTTNIEIGAISDGQDGSAALQAIGASSTARPYRKLKISLYERSGANGSTTYYPIGIYMTATAGNKGKSFIDIYGGGNVKGGGTSATIVENAAALAIPNVRIGNLQGLKFNIGSTTIDATGWGIYTDNGYFNGTIYSTRGYIGGWTLGTSAIYNNTDSKTSTTAGTYLGIDAIRNYNSSTQYVHIEGGKITAQGADITGEIKADTGRIGGSSGWTIASQQIYSGSIGTNNSMFLSTKDLAGTVAGTTLTTTAPSWRLTVGSNFGVDNTGKLYASGAEISGTIDATSFIAKSYTGTTLNRQMSLGADGLKLMDGLGAILSQIDGSASTIGKTSGNNYNINITGTAIDLRYNNKVLNRINSDGMTLYDGYGVADSNILAKFDTNGAQIGREEKTRIKIMPKKIEAISGVSTNPNEYKQFKYFELGDNIGETLNLNYTGDGENRIFQAYEPIGGSAYNEIYVNGVLYSGTVYSERIPSLTTCVCWFPSTITSGSSLHIEVTYLDFNEIQKVYTRNGGTNESAELPYGSTPISVVETISGNTTTYTELYYKNIEAKGFYYIFADSAPAEDSDIQIKCKLNSYISVPYIVFNEQKEGLIGVESMTFGSNSLASGNRSLAIGCDAEANGEGSVCISTEAWYVGQKNCAYGDYSIAIGSAEAMGWGSTAIGENVRAGSQGQTVLGCSNKLDLDDKYVFIVGNGSVGYPLNYSNALTVDWSGNVIAQGMAGQIIMTACPAGGPGSTTLVPANNTTVYEPIPGWLVCNGAAVSRTEYSTLFAVIKTTYGAGDGSNTFNLPDFRGRVGVGAGTGTASGATAHTLNQKAGSETVTLTTGQTPLKAHSHGAGSGQRFMRYNYDDTQAGLGELRVASSTSGSNYVPRVADSKVDFSGIGSTASTSDSDASAHPNMQPYIGVNYIICTGKTN